MRKEVLSLFLIILYISSQGQESLSGSMQTGPYTYIYRINEKEANSLFRSAMKKFGEQYLHTIVDSFLASKGEMPKLERGNYLFVQASKNRLECKLNIIDDLQYKLITNNHDLIISLHTKSGSAITNATVFINKKKVPFDKDLQAFRIAKRRRSGTIRIYHEKVLHQFSLANNRNYYQNSFFRKLAYSFPLKYITKSIKQWLQNRDRYYYYFSDKVRYEKKFTGFMVFSKPMYKPGDTVKGKAFVLDQNKKPVNRPLLLRLTENGFGLDSVIATIKPYRPGAYEYQFVLTDSLDLSLDEEYLLTLEELSSRKYNLDEYTGELDDEQYAIKRKILMRGKFEYEEYELSSVTFTARSDKKEHNRGNPLSIYLKATDENGMAIMDGRVEIVVKPVENRSTDFYKPYVYLPDTIWHHSGKLEPIGETKITLPESVFPAASFHYQIECTFLNSNNELQTETLFQQYKYDRYKIMIEQKNDSLLISQINGHTPDSVDASIISFGSKDDTIHKQIVRLPASVHINPYVAYYEVETDSSYEEHVLKQSKGMVSCVALRTRDSVTIQVMNPGKLFFWYTLFAGNKIIRKGYTDNFFFQEKSRTARNYFISLQYVYGNKSFSENYTAAYQDKLLSVQAEQPVFVYPGQTTNITVSITDASGKPVKDADVTAYGFTKKFENSSAPYIPYLGRLYPNRKRYSSLYEQKNEEGGEGSIMLNWQRWSREMRLDSIEYYRFLYTKTIYRNVESAKDSITQIAPFIVLNGVIQPVHQIYIDEIPVFFNQSQQLQRYSFFVRPGKHSIRLRTHQHMVMVDSIWATAGCKTFFSIHADTATNKMIRLEKMPDSLTAYEKNLWSRYMLLIENNFGKNFSYMAQNNRVTLLNYPANADRLTGKNILVGPLPDHAATLVVKNKFEQTFEAEGNYLFEITKGLIKQKQLPGNRSPFYSTLSASIPDYNFKDFVLTEKEVDSLWEEYLDHRNAAEDLFRNQDYTRKYNGRLMIDIKKENKEPPLFVKNIFLFRYDDPVYLRIYKGSSKDLGYLQPGTYRLLLLLKGDQYIIEDSVQVRAYGVNYYAIGNSVILPKDSVSIRIAAVVNSREPDSHNTSQEFDLDNIRESFNEKFLDPSILTRTISGQVKDAKDGSVLPGISVIIKGTRIGTLTDRQGYFQLKAPQRATLSISGVGYNSVEKRAGEEDYYEIRLSASAQHLSEVVVTAYGITRNRKELGYSVAKITDATGTILYGKAAGVIIRGTATIQSAGTPLFFVDGLSYSGDILKLDTSKISSILILKGEEATALYGSAAANGVILITTKANAISNVMISADNSPLPGTSIRRNFKDDAFWQPRLRTNTEGKTSFRVTFPDDITNWRTFYIAMEGKQSGFAEQQIKSFKPLNASITTPAFLITDDSANIIGKTLNYSMDTVAVHRTFYINKMISQQKQFQLKNSWLDTFAILAGTTDSMTFSYSIHKSDGYFDGEERTIPVFKKGIVETAGLFAVLEKDTFFTYQPKDGNSSVKLYAEASVLPVLLDEMEHIRRYEYLCNEQLASKLKALLLKRKIYRYIGKEFGEEKNIKELIVKLNQGRGQAGLWGWWNNNELSLWISLHAIEALLLAEQDGYAININKTALIDYLVLNLESYRGVEKIACLHILKLLKAKIDFQKYIEAEEKSRLVKSLYEKLRIIQLKQELGMTVSLDTLLKKSNSTMFGNLYWGEENNRFFDNSVQNTLLMYRLMRKQGGYEIPLLKLRNYFLEKRKGGQWANTYESSLILETILPDLMKNDSLPKPATLRINSSETIRSFPYSIEIKAGEKIEVTKQGDLPIYFTAYQQYWNSSPQKVSGDFTVNSFFEKNDGKITLLKAGEPAILKINVRVKADADYIMIEVPIPAGCSYKDKTQSYSNNEVHREYFKNKVSIFCKSLQKGDYTFTVSLLPRYTGQYTLNPAKAEMMYFPVFYGREEIKKVEVR